MLHPSPPRKKSCRYTAGIDWQGDTECSGIIFVCRRLTQGRNGKGYSWKEVSVFHEREDRDD